MTILVGLGPQDDHCGIEFAATLARTDGQDLVAVSVVPAPWPTPVASGVDRDYAAWASEQGRASAIKAQAMLTEYAGDLTTRTSWVRGRSAPSALRRESRSIGAQMIVLGSSRSVGRVALGSTADALVHSSPIPVAVAIRGFRTPASGQIKRATLAFRGDNQSVQALRRTAEICVRSGVSLRVVTFAVSGPGMFTAGVGRSERLLSDQWVENVAALQDAAVQDLAELGMPAADVEQVVARGGSWDKALHRLPWHEDDVLVVGSSKEGRLTRLFLGPTGTRIVRASPVPVVVAR